MATSPLTISITDDTFEQEVLQSSLPVLVDFWAPWCGPCRLMAPVIDAIAAEFAGQIKVVKLNIDEHDRFASQYQIHAIPTLLVFEKGKVAGEWVGVVSARDLATQVKSLLKQQTIAA